MKTNNSESAGLLSAKRKSTKRIVLRIFLLAVVLVNIVAPFNAMAANQRFVLDFEDSRIRGYRGEAATIYLKKSFKNQYPWVDVSDKELRRVVLVAKSKRGRGGALLRVGDRMTDMYKIEGRARDFNDYRRYTFDRVHFSNPSPGSRGPWQMDLRGNFVVRKVVLEMDDRPRHRKIKRWRKHKN